MKSKTYKLRLTEELHQKLLAMDGNFPKVARQILTNENYLEIVRNNDVMIELLLELNASGRNINQIARRLHSDKNTKTANEILAVIKNHDEIINKIRKLILS